MCVGVPCLIMLKDSTPKKEMSSSRYIYDYSNLPSLLYIWEDMKTFYNTSWIKLIG